MRKPDQATPHRLSAAEVARQLGTHPASITRWILKGAALRDGSRHRLNALRTPGGWLIEQAALDAFLARLTSDALGGPAPIDTRAHDDADAALDAAGW